MKNIYLNVEEKKGKQKIGVLLLNNGSKVPSDKIKNKAVKQWKKQPQASKKIENWWSKSWKWWKVKRLYPFYQGFCMINPLQLQFWPVQKWEFAQTMTVTHYIVKVHPSSDGPCPQETPTYKACVITSWDSFIFKGGKDEPIKNLAK